RLDALWSLREAVKLLQDQSRHTENTPKPVPTLKLFENSVAELEAKLPEWPWYVHIIVGNVYEPAKDDPRVRSFLDVVADQALAKVLHDVPKQAITPLPNDWDICGGEYIDATYWTRLDAEPITRRSVQVDAKYGHILKAMSWKTFAGDEWYLDIP